MHNVVANNESGPYLDAFFELVQQGCQRFLLCGKPLTQFQATVSSDPGLQSLTIRNLVPAGAATDSEACFANAADNALTDEKWDAVFIFGPETLQTHASDLCQIAPTCHLVYHKQRAERPIVVSLNKGGSNLVARLIRTLDFEPLGEGIRESYAQIERIASDVKDYPFRGEGAMLPLLLRKASPNNCIFFHLLPVGPHLAEWVNHAAPPPILFNYRDPRAVIVSLIHYLAGQAREEFTKVPWYVNHARMLSRLETMKVKIDYATNCFGDFLDQAYRQHAWLLYDPAVYQTSYERLVGTAGGGNEQDQLCAVSGAMLHFGIGGDPRKIASQLYDTGARTFRKGSVRSWRDEFSPNQLASFNTKYRDILELYGYE